MIYTKLMLLGGFDMKYVKPEIEIIVLSTADVLNASENKNKTEPDWFW